MATSGNPAKRAKATSGKKWKRNRGEDLELPSGNVALVKRPGPASLLNAGVMPDTLMPIIEQAIRNGQGLKPQDAADLVKDPKKIVEMLDSMDRLMPLVVVEPQVLYHRRESSDQLANGSVSWEDIPEQDRISHAIAKGVSEEDAEDALWTDEVDIDDKMFIFQYAVGGTRDLERFREQQRAGLGDLSPSEGASDASVGSTGGSEE